MASASGIKSGRAWVEMSLDDKKLVRGLRRSSRRLKSFGAGMTGIGKKILGATSAIAAPIALATKVFAGFDDAMRTVKAVTGASATDFAKLTETAKLLGRTTSFTASQVAELMTELGRAGFDPSQVDAMTRSVLDLSRATGTDAAQAAGIASATLRQFGLQAQETGRVADVLTAGANKSFNTLESLGEALKFAGPVAADANMSLEDTVAILGALGNVGIQGSNAGSALRRLLVLSASEAEKFGEVFGVATKDAAGDARPLMEILSDIDTATADLGSADRSAKFAEAFGLLGVTAASSLSKATDGVFDLRTQLGDVKGLAADTAKEMDGGIGGAGRKLLSALEGIAIAIGEAAAGPLGKFADKLSALSGYITTIVEKNRGFVKSLVKILAIAAGVGSALLILGLGVTLIGVALGAAATIVSTFAGAVGLAVAAIGLILSPIGLVIAAVATLVGVVLYATGAGGKAVDWLVGRFEALRDGVLRVVGGIVDALKAGDIKLAARILWLGLKLAWATGIGTLQTYWAEFSRWFTGIASDAFYGSLIILNNVVAGMQTAWASFVGFLASKWTDVKGDAAETWNAITLMAKKAGIAMRDAVDQDYDADAATRRVEDKFVEDQHKAQNERKTRQTEIEKDKQNRHAQIERDRATTEKGLVDAADQADAKRTSDLDKRKNEIGDELKNAEDELRAAIADASRKRRDAEAAADGDGDAGKPSVEKANEELKKILSNGGGTVDAASTNAAFKSAGTFDARQVGGLAGRQMTEGERRQLEKLEKMEEHLRRVAKRNALRNGKVAT